MQRSIALLLFSILVAGCNPFIPTAGLPNPPDDTYRGLATGTVPEPGTLTAGDIDDNLNLAAYSQYLTTAQTNNTSQWLPSIQVDDRITIQVSDELNNPLAQIELTITPLGLTQPSLTTQTNVAGLRYFYPAMQGFADITDITIKARNKGTLTPIGEINVNLASLNASRTINFNILGASTTPPLGMDIMFVVDTTASMHDELDFIQTEFSAIISRLQLNYPNIAMRFGIVAYRDIGDPYVVKSNPFTNDMNLMQAQLISYTADGGGDAPEAMDQGLKSAVNADWSTGNEIRLIFLIADAPPHPQYMKAALNTYAQAYTKGIHIHSLVASGVGPNAEYVMRGLSALTQGRYLFLTDDSKIGNTHAEPDIPCYIVTRLDQLVERVIASEISGMRVEPLANEIIRVSGNYDAGVCLPAAATSS